MARNQMNTCDLNLFIAAISNTIIANNTEEELNFLGSVFTQVGSTLLTAAANIALCESINKNNNAKKDDNAKKNDNAKNNDNVKKNDNQNAENEKKDEMQGKNRVDHIIK